MTTVAQALGARARAGVDRLDAQLLLAHACGAAAHLAARARRRARWTPPRSRAAKRDCRAPRRRRAAGLPARREGVPRPAAARRRRRCWCRGPTPRRWSTGRSSCWRARCAARPPRSSTSAPAAARSRWRVKHALPARRGHRHRRQRGGAGGRARQCGAARPGVSRSPRATGGRPWPATALRPRAVQPAVRRRRRPAPGGAAARAARGADAGRRRAGRAARRSSPARPRICARAAGCCSSTATTRPTPCARCLRAPASPTSQTRRDLAGQPRCTRRPPASEAVTISGMRTSSRRESGACTRRCSASA